MKSQLLKDYFHSAIDCDNLLICYLLFFRLWQKYYEKSEKGIDQGERTITEPVSIMYWPVKVSGQ